MGCTKKKKNGCFGYKKFGMAIDYRKLNNITVPDRYPICYVYIDDIIIFGKTEQQHFENIKKVFRTLESVNMKVQLDKREFFKPNVGRYYIDIKNTCQSTKSGGNL